MISDKVANAINTHINAEIYSAYLYMSMSTWCSAQGLAGAANWMMIQAKEEMTHAQRMLNYINAQGKQVILTAIDAPPTEFTSLKSMFEEVLAHEQKVTGLINALATLAKSEQDHATDIFLQWFISEQVEEEETANDTLAKVALAGDTPGGAYMLDKELAGRVYTPPADLA